MIVNTLYLTVAALSSLATGSAIPGQTRDASYPQQPNISRREVCDKAYAVGGNIAYLVAVDTMAASMAVRDGDLVDNCKLNQSKSFASTNTVWSGDCDSGAHMEITGVGGNGGVARYVHDGGEMEFQLSVIKNDIYTCGEAGSNGTPVKCQEISFEGCADAIPLPSFPIP